MPESWIRYVKLNIYILYALNYILIFSAGFAKRFGLKPEHFAVNVRDNYQRHEVDQESVDPYKLAGEYCNE